jgi:CBS domain containing-hemolysin-like protein
MTGFSITLIVFLAVSSLGLAAVEAAFYLLRRRHLGHLTQEGTQADRINAYLDEPARLLMPVHIGSYTANVGMTVLLTVLFLDRLLHLAALVAFLVMLAYLLLLRLTVPYALVRERPERALMLLMPVFHPYATALSPLVRLLRRPLRGRETPEASGPGAILELPPAPVHDSDQIRLIDALVRFSETQVREVMTPRPDVVAIAATATVADLREVLRESLYSRIPVFQENLDDIVGVVTLRDVLEYDGDPRGPLRPLVRPVILAPETKKIGQVLKELQDQGKTLAVVIDEYGGTAGLVTVEDIVEELVGEIKDEYDVETEPIVVEDDGAVLVAGRTSLDRLEETLEVDLADGSDVDTVGGLATSVFGRIPRIGERVDFRGLSIEVVDAERKRVNRVRLRRLPVEAGD